jgi:hypothetical protein
MSSKEKIFKSEGVTHSEKYLIELCNNSFLSLWSYPNVFRNRNKELTDVIVVFDNHILVFSDKACEYPTIGDAKLNWRKWFKKSVLKSAEQLWGAERWLKLYPDRVYTDRMASQKLPIEIQENAIIHLIAVAKGVAKPCKKYFNGGSGSLIIKSDIVGSAAHIDPFVVGDINPNETFIHVFDDTTLDIILQTLDTISDFTQYLSRKEELFRIRKLNLLATGEEDLLPFYLARMKNGRHDFVFDHDGPLCIDEGEWIKFNQNPRRIGQVMEDSVSYFWDALIERFSHNALNATQYRISDGGFSDSEKILRFFASEPRHRRRLLSATLIHLIENTPKNVYGCRYIKPDERNGAHYAFVVFPNVQNLSEELYLQIRVHYLTACCMVFKLVNPEVQNIVGYATMPGLKGSDVSEDVIYLDCNEWNDELQEQALEYQKQYKILLDPKPYDIYQSEFPKSPFVENSFIQPDNFCPCGSGVEYRNCHGVVRR